MVFVVTVQCGARTFLDPDKLCATDRGIERLPVPYVDALGQPGRHNLALQQAGGASY